MTTKERLTKLVKRATNLGIVWRSNTLIAKFLRKYAKTLPKGQTKDRQNQLADYIELHPELCYDEIIQWTIQQWGRDDDLLKHNMLAAKQVSKLTHLTAWRKIKSIFPDLPEEL